MERLPFVLLFSGLVALVFSVILGWVLVPDYIHNQIEQQVHLKNGSETFEKWKDVTVPVFIKFRFFNVTNSKDVGDKGEKPILQELGPYVYQQKRYKTDIEFNEVNDTVSYRQPVIYYFRPDLSNGSEDDIVTTLNMPLIRLGEAAEKGGKVLRILYNMYVGRYNEGPFVSKKVSELLFEGYYVELIDNLQNVTRKSILPNSTFGLYYGKNGTDDGVYEVRTGKDASTFGDLVSWNGMMELPWWGKEGGGQSCNKINGSDGSIFPPFVRKDRIIKIFNSDLCRSIHLTYYGEIEFKGIPSLRFTIPQSLFQDAGNNPDNRCFCTKPNPVSENCPKTGIIQLSACRKGAPVVASTPHFLDGDLTYVNQSVGLSPDRTIHETFLHLEPNTGLILEGKKRIQINIQTKPSKGLDVLKNLPEMIFPIFWVEESATALDTTVDRLKSKLLFTIDALQIAKWIFVCLSSILIVFGISVFCLRTRRKRQFV